MTKQTQPYAPPQQPDPPEPTRRTRRNRLVRLIPIITCLLVAGASLAVTMAIDTAYQSEATKDKRLQAMASLNSARDKLESVIYTRLMLAKNFAGYLENHPNADTTDLALMARDLLRNDQAITGVRVARRDTVRFVFPKQGRMHLLDTPMEETLPPADHAVLPMLLTEARPYLGGPVNGPDNRLIFLCIIPIYQTVVGIAGSGPFWGFAVLELDVRYLLHAADISDTSVLPLAVRILGASNETLIHGAQDMFGPTGIISELNATWGKLQLGTIPPNAAVARRVSWLLGIAVAMLLGAATGFAAHQVLQRIRTQEQYRELVQNARSIIMRVTPAGSITFFNEYATEFFGFSEDETVNRHLLQTILPSRDESGNDMAEFLMEVLAAPENHPFFELATVRKDSVKVWVAWAIRPLRDETGQLLEILLVGSDLTTRKELEARLQEMATTDPLTGAPNRRHFVAQASLELQRALRYDRPLSLLMLDLDHFKRINDEHGHHVGDLALKAVTEAILESLRDQDICGRMGGEEFAVLLPETDERKAITAAERIRATVDAIRITLPSGKEVTLTASLGVASSETDTTLEDMLRHADKALYRAKANGRNRVET